MDIFRNGNGCLLQFEHSTCILPSLSGHKEVNFESKGVFVPKNIQRVPPSISSVVVNDIQVPVCSVHICGLKGSVEQYGADQ